MPTKISERRLQRDRAQAASRRGQAILAKKFMDAHTALSLCSRNYSQLDPLERRQRVNRCITALMQSFSIIEGEEPLAPLDELKRSLHSLDAGIEPPLLARSPQAADAAARLLSRKAPRKRQKLLIGAWALAALQRLLDEEMPPKVAVEEVAQSIDTSVRTIQNWRADLQRDNAPLLPLPRGKHLQRLRFRVPFCVNYAAAHGLTGKQMLALIESDPALVHGFSARRDIWIPTSSVSSALAPIDPPPVASGPQSS